MKKLQRMAHDELISRGYEQVRTYRWGGDTESGSIEHYTHANKRSVLLVLFDVHGGCDVFAEVDVTRSSDMSATLQQLDALNGEENPA